MTRSSPSWMVARKSGGAEVVRLLLLVEAEDAVQIVHVVEVQSSPLSPPFLLS